VIENVRENNYFSEKLLDAVFCETVPIYWGCPNIDRFIDPEGLINCETGEDVRAAVQNMSVEDYQHRLPAIRSLKDPLQTFADIDLRAARVIEKEIATAG
jgi:hypothetical protein